MSDTLTITASNIRDASGTVIATGTFSVQATDQYDVPIPFGIGTTAQATKSPVTKPIHDGAVTGLTLGNPASSRPSNILYKITIQDTSQSPTVTTVYKKVHIVDDGSGNWSFDTMNTGLLQPAIPVSIISGPPGRDGADGSAAAITTLASSVLRKPANLFDWTKVIDGSYIGLTGAVTSFSGWSRSGLIYCPGATQFIANFSILSYAAYTRVALFDTNGTYISSLADAPNGSDFPAGTTITLPGTQTYVAFSIHTGTTGSTSMLMAGTTANPATLPGSFVSFGPNLASEEAANIAAALGTVATSGTLAAQAATPVAVNLFDVNKMITDYIVLGSGSSAGQLSAFSGAHATGYIPVFGLTHFSSNFIFFGYQDDGIAFYDAAQNVMPSAGITENNGNITNPTTVKTYPVPAGAYYMRGWIGSFNANGPAGAMLVAGTTPPPDTTTGYVPFAGNPNPFVPALAAVGGWVGKSLAWIGDSISSYRNGPTPKVLTMLNMNQSYKTALPGRYLWQAFEATGAGWPTPTALTDGTITNVAPTPANFQNADAIVVFLGNNITNTANMGTLTAGGAYSPANDPPTTVYPVPSSTPSDSWASQLAGVFVQLLTWNPLAKIVWVEPYQSAHYTAPAVPQSSIIGRAVAAYYAIPVVPLYDESGITPLTWPLYLGSPDPGGESAWSSTTTYAAGQWASFSGVNYQSLIAGNLNNTPGVYGSRWWQAAGDNVHPQQIGLDNAISPLIARKLMTIAPS